MQVTECKIYKQKAAGRISVLSNWNGENSLEKNNEKKTTLFKHCLACEWIMNTENVKTSI